VNGSGKITTIKDVARKAGVAPSTVSRVINDKGYVSPEAKKRVQDAVEELKFRPNSLARGLGGGQTQTIALILPDITNIFFPAIARSVEDAAMVQDYTVILCNSENDPVHEEEYLRILEQKSVDGIVIAGTGPKGSHIRRAIKKGIPIVLIDRRLDGAVVDSVFCDNAAGSYLAVNHLLDEGHREVAFLGGPMDISTTREREDGYKLAHQERGLAVDRNLIRYGEFKYESGFQQMNEILNEGRRPTAVFAANDMLAIGANRAIEANNLKIPDDISLVGYDDILWAALEKPPLTTVAQPIYRMGMTACELLLERINGPEAREPRQIVLKPELVIRQSTRREGNITCRR
jgi:LacI family transcriptional regulator